MPAISDSLLQTWGGLTLPAQASDLNEQGLSSLDPGRDVLLALFASAINSELGEAWSAAVATLPGSHPLSGSQPVQDTLPHAPDLSTMTSRRGEFPLLAISREGTATYEEHTLEKSRLTQQWALTYVLSPLDMLDKRKLGDILSAIPKVVALVIKRRGHLSYEQGALQFFDGGRFDAIRMVSSQSGNVAFAEGAQTVWNVCEMILETSELTGWRDDAFGPLEASDYVIGVGDDAEGILPAVVLGSTDESAQS